MPVTADESNENAEQLDTSDLLWEFFGDGWRNFRCAESRCI